MPFPWITFDLRKGVQHPLAERLLGEEFLAELSALPEDPYLDFLDFGIVGIEPDLGQLFARPPLPMFLNVSRIRLFEGLTGDQLVSAVKASLADLSIQLHSVTEETVNGLPAARGGCLNRSHEVRGG